MPLDTGSVLWNYLSSDERQLVRDGELLISDRSLHPNEKLSDYSYLVFPFAKLYEGFLKHILLDLGIIGEAEYRSDHFRIGKALSMNLVKRLGEKSAYLQLKNRYGELLAVRLWHTWKEGRNLVFHYFPHNYRALTEEEAKLIIGRIISAMEKAVEVTEVNTGMSFQ